MGKNKMLLCFYFGINFLVAGQVKSTEQILNELSNEGEIVGFVENYTEKSIW